MTRWVRIAPGDYETEDGRYRIYRIPDLRPPAWNCETVWTDEEHSTGTAYAVTTELVVDGAASLHDAKALFEREIEEYDTMRRNAR